VSGVLRLGLDLGLELAKGVEGSLCPALVRGCFRNYMTKISCGPELNVV
jgi:hypothetical protein